MNVKKVVLPELLAPAGNMERLSTAFRYGADAVYLGATAMSLRNFADNFTPDSLREACDYAHSIGKRVYLACNAFANDTDIDNLPIVLDSAAKANVDALIVNDPGVIRFARKHCPHIPLHLSTQANTLNTQAAIFWHEQGIKRIILARELSISAIKHMRENTPKSLELEMFVHGAMCISYSGRCLLSNYLQNRDSNKGECAQPCRWSYELRERGSGSEHMQIVQDAAGTHILNSRDMNLIEHLPEVIDTGVCSIKIEGRMKSVSYVAAVVNAYRMALDIYSEAALSGTKYSLPQNILSELYAVSHRPYTTGFAFGDPGAQGQAVQTSKYEANSSICGIVLEYNNVEKTALVRQRNRFFVGDTLSILAPRDISRSFTVTSIRDEEGNPRESAPHPNEHLFLACDEPLSAGDILRKRIE